MKISNIYHDREPSLLPYRFSLILTFANIFVKIIPYIYYELGWGERTCLQWMILLKKTIPY